MAKTFNLTAQLNLAGPNNIKPIINNIRQQLGNISVGVNVKINPSTINSINGFDKRIKALNTSLGLLNSTALGLTTTLQQLGQAFNAFNSAGTAAKNINASARALKQVQQSAGAASTQMEEFGRQSALAVRRFTAFSVATGAIFGVVGALKTGFSEAVKFDKEMVKLSQVTGLAVSQLSDVSAEVTRLSQTLGVSSNELINVATTLAQAGLSAKDTKIALEALAKSSLAPSFKDINETTEASIAILAQFGLKAKDLEGVLGSVNAVSAAFAVEAEDITAAIRRAGGVFATAAKGISAPKDALNEFIAIFSSVRSTTRESAETIATGLRTIFTRIQRGSTIELLKKFGVELTDLEGKFVGPYEAVNRLSVALNRIDPRDTQFSQIVEELGGFRQISKVIPLIQQFEARTQALAVAQRGSTSLTEAAAVAQESLANQFAKVQEKFLGFVRSLSQTSSFQTMVTLTLKLASGLITVADAAKPLIPLIAAIGAVKGFSALSQIGRGFFGGIKGAAGNIATIAGANGPGGGGGPGSSGAAIGSNTVSVNQNTYAIQQLTAAVHNFSFNRFNTPYPVGASSPLPRKFARGGLVPGSGNGDTVPAMLAPGEFVLRKSAVNSIGAGHLSRVNLANGPGVGGQGISKAVSSLTPEQQLIAKQAEFARQNGQPATRDGFFALPNKLRNQFKAQNQAQESQAELAGNTLYLDGSRFAGVFKDQTGTNPQDFTANSVYREAGSVGKANIDSAINKYKLDKNKTRIASKPGLYHIDDAGFRQHFEDVYPALEDATVNLVKPMIAGLYNDNSLATIKESLNTQKDNVLGVVFEAALKGVAGEGKGGLFSGGPSTFDLYPTGRDAGANFKSLFGNQAGQAISKTEFVDAKINSNSDTIADIFGKAITAGVPLVKKLASGGHIGGSGTGDSVPALLTPGEFVINKRAADSIGRDVLHGMNTGKVGRFAAGTPFPSSNPNSRNDRTNADRLRILLRNQLGRGIGPQGLLASAGGAFAAQQGANAIFGDNSPASQGVSGAIGGAFTGAYAGGKVGGAPGAAIGAVVGGIVIGLEAFSKALKEAKVQQAFDRLSASTAKVESAFEKFTNGRVKGTGAIDKELGVSNEAAADAVKFSQLTDREALSNTRNESKFSTNLSRRFTQFKDFVGIDTTDEKASRVADVKRGKQSRLSKITQETQANAAIGATLTEQLTKQGGNLFAKDTRGNDILSNLGKDNLNSVKSLAFKGSAAADTVELLDTNSKKQKEEEFAARDSSEKIAAVREKYAKLEEDILIKQGIIVGKEISDRAVKENALLEAYRNSGKALIAFSKIFSQVGAIADANTAKLEANNAALDARVANLTGQGTVGPISSGISSVLGNKDAFSKDKYNSTVDQLLGAFGPNDALSQTASFAKGGKTLDDDLTKIISDSLIDAKKNTGTNAFEKDEEGNATVTRRVQEGVDKLGLPPALAKSVSSVITAELASRQDQTLEQIVEKFKNADKFAESAKVAQEALAKLGESFDKASNQYIQNLNKLVGLRGATLNAGDKAANIRANNTIELAEAFGKELTAQQLNAPIQEQISRLGGGITGSGQLANKFSALNSKAANIADQQKIALVNNNGNEFVRLGKAASDTAVEIDRTKRALELLADGTRKAAIQTKLGEEQQKRSNGRNFLTTLGTAGPQQQFQFMKQAMAFLQFRGAGNKLDGNPFQAADVKGFIDLVGPLLGQEKNDKLNAQFADAIFNNSPFAAVIKQMPIEFQDAMKNAITQQGQGGKEQQLIGELKQVQIAQQQAADALTDIANNADRVYGQQIVGLLREFVRNIGNELKGISNNGPEPPFEVAAPGPKGPRPPVRFLPAGFANGGPVYASDGGDIFEPRGTDIVPAMLTPGEFVVNARSASANRGLLENINRMSTGGTVYLASGGGITTNLAIDSLLSGWASPHNVTFGLGSMMYRLDESYTDYLKKNRGQGQAKPIEQDFIHHTNYPEAFTPPRYDQNFKVSTSNYGVDTPAAIPRVNDSRTPVWNPKTRRYEFTEAPAIPRGNSGALGGQAVGESTVNIVATTLPGEKRAISSPGRQSDERVLAAQQRLHAAGRLQGVRTSGAFRQPDTIGVGGAGNPISDLAKAEFNRRRELRGDSDSLVSSKPYVRRSDGERAMDDRMAAARKRGLVPEIEGFGNEFSNISARDRVTARAQSRAARRGRGRGRSYFADGGSVGSGGSGGGGGGGAIPNFDNFVKAVQNLGTYMDKLTQLNIPSSITLKAEIAPVKIVMSGENALASAVVEQMKGQISSMIFSAMKAHINPLTGETNEGIVSPGSISNRTV